MKPLAIRAAYSDLKLVKTRQVAQLIFEIPISEFDAAYDVLGGLPNPANEQWFGIAPIKPAKEVIEPDAKPEPESPHAPQPARAKRDWRDLSPSQQAGMRCQEQAFLKFLEEEHMSDLREAGTVPDCVRLICGVGSRADLDTNQKARVIWHQLNDQYTAWMRVVA